MTEPGCVRFTIDMTGWRLRRMNMYLLRAIHLE